MFDPDKPIECKDEEDCKDKDKLRRWKYSKKLGEAILKYDGDDSLVIGLEGQWGHGKTSIINMALTHIKNKQTENEEHPPIIVKFNPWLFSSQNQLIQKFFDELIIGMEDQNIKEKLKSYVDRLIPPVIGLASIIDPTRTQALLSTSEYMNSSRSEEESLESLKKEINGKIRDFDRKIIVVIDDIDRLSTFEIRQTFQLVKLLADFPNTTYLLSFDRNVVVGALGEVQSISGEEYLKKIVQIPFEVPEIYKGYIETFLFEKIDMIIESEENFDEKYWWNLYHSGLKYLFNNLRDVKLYINSLKFNFEIVKGEVNPVDFLAITALQTFENDLYQGLRNNKDILTKTFHYRSNAQTIKDQAKSRCDEIINKSSIINNNGNLKELLTYMFPQLDAIYSNTIIGEGWFSEWRTKLRICSPDKFETYFRLSLPDNEISEQEIKSIFALSNDPDSFSDALFKLGNKVIRFLERFEDFTTEFPKENIENVIKVLMNIGDKFPDKQTEFLGYDTPMRILRIIHQLIFLFPTYHERFGILKRSIENAEDSLYIAVHEIGVEDQTHGLYNLAKNPSPKNEWKVNSKQLGTLEQLVCEKIQIWAADGRLIEDEHFIQIIFDWKRWEKDEALKYVNEIIKEDTGLIIFITNFLTITKKYTITDKVSESITTMKIDDIESFVKIDEIEPRIRGIVSSQDFDQLDEKSQDALKMFLEKYDE